MLHAVIRHMNNLNYENSRILKAKINMNIIKSLQVRTGAVSLSLKLRFAVFTNRQETR